MDFLIFAVGIFSYDGFTNMFGKHHWNGKLESTHRSPLLKQHPRCSQEHFSQLGTGFDYVWLEFVSDNVTGGRRRQCPGFPQGEGQGAVPAARRSGLSGPARDPQKVRGGPTGRQWRNIHTHPPKPVPTTAPRPFFLLRWPAKQLVYCSIVNLWHSVQTPMTW